jgi:hypothetical protein
MQAWLNWDPVRRSQYTGINEGVNQTWTGLQGLGNTAVIGSGFAPSGFALDDATRTAIEKANRGGLSTLAQMADAYQRRNASQTANLGQRGIVRSGAFGANALQSAKNYAINKSQALLALENTLGGYHQQGLAAEQAAIGQRTQSDQDSLDRMIELIKSGIIAWPGAAGTGGGAGGGAGTAAPQIPGGPIKQFPSPIVNQNPGAPGQAFVGGMPKPNPAAYGQPNPVIHSPGASVFGPKPSPVSYGQPRAASPRPFVNNPLSKLTPHGRAPY